MKKILLVALLAVGSLWLFCRDSLPERMRKAKVEISKTCDKEFSKEAQEQFVAKTTALEKTDAGLAKQLDRILQECKKESTCPDVKTCISGKMDKWVEGDLSLEQFIRLLDFSLALAQ